MAPHVRGETYVWDWCGRCQPASPELRTGQPGPSGSSSKPCGHNVQHTLQRTQRTAHAAADTTYSTRCSGHNVQHTLQRTRRTAHAAADTTYSTRCSGHDVQHTLQRTQRTAHAAADTTYSTMAGLTRQWRGEGE